MNGPSHASLKQGIEQLELDLDDRTTADRGELIFTGLAWELEALGQLLVKVEDDGSAVFFQVRALAIRICNLSGVVIMAVGDIGPDTGELMETVCPGSKGAA